MHILDIRTLIVGLGIKSVFAVPEGIGDDRSILDAEFEAPEILLSDEGK